MTESTRPDVDARYWDACRQVGNQLVQRARKLRMLYFGHSGLRTDQIVVLAGTNLVAALTTASTGRTGPLMAWTFDRRTGVLADVMMRETRMLVCEDAELGLWQYRLMVPTQEDMLGRPTVERGTIEVTTS